MYRTKEDKVYAIINTILGIPPSNEDMLKIIQAVDDLACQVNLFAAGLASRRIASENFSKELR